jgi:hypothetical protein
MPSPKWVWLNHQDIYLDFNPSPSFPTSHSVPYDKVQVLIAKKYWHLSLNVSYSLENILKHIVSQYYSQIMKQTTLSYPGFALKYICSECGLKHDLTQECLLMHMG